MRKSYFLWCLHLCKIITPLPTLFGHYARDDDALLRFSKISADPGHLASAKSPAVRIKKSRNSYTLDDYLIGYRAVICYNPSN